MVFYEAPDEIDDVRAGGLGVEETRSWHEEFKAVARWFGENPRYISGPRFEVIPFDGDTVITGKQIGWWTMQICPDDLPNNVEEFLEDSQR